ncbi:hypothetical protein EI94DRAFT_1836641 [Lactarius quietus]|nr:hypothetical protein EI94DRAFT_1836641 [Lactarius quietus]
MHTACFPYDLTCNALSYVAAMSGPDHLSAAHLSALRLSRQLAQEFPNTRAICLNNSWNPDLANELAEAETLLSDVLRGISILRSNLRPVNRLPTELLSHIFSFLGGGAYVVPASHVCQQWRDIALGTPSLWTTIREDDPFFAAQCFMERSRLMKLDVSWVVYMYQEGVHLLEAAFAHHATRIWRLHVIVYGDRVCDFYRSLATCALVMPALENFSIIMIEYGGFPDDSRVDGPPVDFFEESEFLNTLTFRATLPLQRQLSPAIRSLTLADKVVDLETLLCCLGAVPNLEYLALLDSVPNTFDASTRPVVVTLPALREFHWFQGRVFDNVLGTVKLFEHLVLPALSSPEFILLLEPTKYAVTDLYAPCHRSTTLFHTITELCLEATHYSPEKPARNNIVFHGRHEHETLFSVRVHRVSIEQLCSSSDGLFLASSVRADLSHLTHLTLTSTHPYNWNRFFRGPSWSRFFSCMPAVRVLRLYVSRPADIINALASADNTSTPLLPALRILHIFRCGKEKGGGAEADTDALSFVDSVEFGKPGNWAKPPEFPRRMGALLEEYLN